MLRNKKGASAVESAVALPVVVFLIVAIIYLAFYVNTHVVVNHAARVGAREYGVHGDRDRAIELIEGELSMAGLSGEPVILIEDQDDAVRVVIHYVRHVPAPAMLNTAGNFDVTGHAVYRRDKQ